MDPYPVSGVALPDDCPTELCALEFLCIFLNCFNVGSCPLGYDHPLTGAQLLSIIGGNHKMGTYLHWMEELPGKRGKTPEEITWSDVY